MELNSKYGQVKIFTDNIEQEALSQVINMANSPLGENAHIRIMPDVHAGAGCTIGTTMRITDKICPNIVGVDIGCGVTLAKFSTDFSDRLEELDKVIHSKIPAGRKVHQKMSEEFDFSELYCWDKLSKDTQKLAKCSLGTLGGGNHFIEAYEGGFLSVHSGSRNIGLKVASYYQSLAQSRFSETIDNDFKKELLLIEPRERENFIKNYNKPVVPKDMMYLEGKDLEDYLHDIAIIQNFAAINRMEMLCIIALEIKAPIWRDLIIESVHNYIDVNERILRKGAIAAHKGERLVIPLNMRDGLLVCVGKGNEDWNYSAPHGAGRLYSRSKAKELFTVTEYAKSMEGIYTTCINNSTLDEAPFVYKDYQEIMNYIQPTVEIEDRLIPIYNFKAGE